MKPIDVSRNYMFISAAICGICLAFLALMTVFIQLKISDRNLGQISVEGTGFVNAVPNVALINLNVRQVAKIPGDAQIVVKEKAQNVLKSLNELGINPEDIKTESYNVAPKYEYPQVPACLKIPCPPQPKAVLLGYEVTQSVSVKIRAVEKVDALFELFGKLGITEFYGPNFVVDDLGKSKEEARAKAINNARIKAVKLAKDLRVDLGKVIAFNEQNNSMQPVLYRAKAEMMAVSADNSGSSNTITPGENKITSNVTITYEIR